jgi:SPP1 gp7 family putative phage head morphogenesis protein
MLSLIFNRGGGAAGDLGAAAAAGTSAVAGDLSLAVDFGGGAPAGQSSVTGALSEAIALQATALAGVSALLGALTLAAPLSGTLSGQSALAGTLVEAVALQAKVAGQSTAVGSLSEAVALTGTASGQSAVAGTLSEAVALQASLAGVSALSGNVALAEALAAAVAGQSSAAAQLVLAEALQGSGAGQSAVVASLVEAVGLAGSTAGQSALVGALSLASGTPLAGAIAGQSALAGALSEAVALAAAASGQSALVGDLSEAVSLSAASAGQSAITAALGFSVPLAGALAGTTAPPAALSLGVAIAAAPAGATALSGDLSLSVQLVAAAAGASALPGDLSSSSPNPPLGGASSGASALIADLQLAVPLSGGFAQTVFLVRLPSPRKEPVEQEIPVDVDVGASSGGSSALVAHLALAEALGGRLVGDRSGVGGSLSLGAALSGRVGGFASDHRPPLDVMTPYGPGITVEGTLRIEMNDIVRRVEKAHRAVLVEEETFARLVVGDTAKAAQSNRERPVVVAARAALHRDAAAFLHALGHRIAAVARGLGKAEEGKDDPVTGAAESVDWTPLYDAARPQLERVAKDGARAGLDQVGADIESLLEQSDPRAIAWAEKRAGEMIAEVSDTTVARVRELVATALEEGWSNDTLAGELADAAEFSDSRAEMIARTESAAADVAGNLIGWKASGVVAQKEWAVAQDSVCPDCEDYDGMVVDLDAEFPQGDPPAHPNCRCDLLPVLAEEDEE